MKKPPRKTVPRERVLSRKRTLTKDHRLRDVPIGHGLPFITDMREELQDMTDVLLGRKSPPVDAGHLTLMEVADAYFARASEMTALIQQREMDGLIKRAEPLYRFRTGELRTFMDMAKRAADLGSRRLTKEQLLYEMSRLGRETGG